MNSHSAQSVSVAVADQRPSMAVVDLIARVDGVDPIELEPLYNVIDPDVLDSLCESSPGLDRLEFIYHGRRVTVEATDDTATETVEISLGEDSAVTDGAGGIVNTEPTI
ncbi:HalOD1 output domain-containing protein [Natrialba hulunbeirensis]|nr:HalOD1 output domain-containing protein [Natrialba hulunbeirensis]